MHSTLTQLEKKLLTEKLEEFKKTIYLLERRLSIIEHKIYERRKLIEVIKEFLQEKYQFSQRVSKK